MGVDKTWSLFRARAGQREANQGPFGATIQGGRVGLMSTGKQTGE